MRPTSDQSTLPGAGGQTVRRFGRAAAIAAATLAGASAAPAVARAETVAETSLAPTGASVSDGTLRKPQPLVRVVDLAPDGSRGQVVTVSDKTRAARLVGETQAKAGAVAVAFDQHLGNGRWEPRVAYRPAGSSAFLPAVPTGPARRSTVADQHPVVLGPDGTGIVLGYGNPHRDAFVRRLAADGTLGPAIVIAPRSIGDVAVEAAFSAAGTVVIAIAARQTVAGLDEDEPGYEAHVYATTLPAGAARPTPLQRLACGPNPGDEIPALDLTVGDDDYAVLSAGLFAPDRTTYFEGPATALR